MEGELQDWEVLQSLGSTSEDNKLTSLEEIEDVTRGMISFDHFSLENSNGVCRVETVDERSEDGSIQSGSPGWIEPRSDAPYGPKHFSELWSDSSSDRLEDQRLIDDVINERGLENSSRSEVGVVEFVKRKVDTEEFSESITQEKNLEKDCLDSSEEVGLLNSDEETERREESSLSIDGNDPLLGEGKPVSIDPSVKSGGDREEKGFVWWKIPIELLKHCAFRVNPIWSFSVAAAVVGFVMLGRRLYNMKKKKKKSRTLQLKVLLDDKKLANSAAGWKEAISVVKRMPIIRPALPSSVGMNQWSMMSLR